MVWGEEAIVLLKKSYNFGSDRLGITRNDRNFVTGLEAIVSREGGHTGLIL